MRLVMYLVACGLAAANAGFALHGVLKAIHSLLSGGAVASYADCFRVALSVFAAIISGMWAVKIAKED